jgi:hypothetical protein
VLRVDGVRPVGPARLALLAREHHRECGAVPFLERLVLSRGVDDFGVGGGSVAHVQDARAYDFQLRVPGAEVAALLGHPRFVDVQVTDAALGK